MVQSDIQWKKTFLTQNYIRCHPPTCKIAVFTISPCYYHFVRFFFLLCVVCRNFSHEARNARKSKSTKLKYFTTALCTKKKIDSARNYAADKIKSINYYGMKTQKLIFSRFLYIYPLDKCWLLEFVIVKKHIVSVCVRIEQEKKAQMKREQ